MNELIFFIHITLLILFVAIGLKRGKESLIVLACLQVILANLFVTKQVVLFSLTVTPTDAYMLGSLLTANVLQEYYGKEEARKLIGLNLFISLFFIGMALIQIVYKPAEADQMHSHFYSVLSVSPRVFIASLISLFLTQKLDIELFAYLRKKLRFSMATAISLMITQAFDTLLFSFLALYGVLSPLSHVIGLSYVIKMLTLASMIPVTTLLIRRKTA